jgi:hypothetical protein
MLPRQSLAKSQKILAPHRYIISVNALASTVPARKFLQRFVEFRANLPIVREALKTK